MPERLAAIGQALTWVKVFRGRDEREPRPRAGRSRKRLPKVDAALERYLTPNGLGVNERNSSAPTRP